MPVVGRPITIHDLLTHTAGITGGIDETPEAAFQVWALRDPWLVFPNGSEDAAAGPPLGRLVRGR